MIVEYRIPQKTAILWTSFAAMTCNRVCYDECRSRRMMKEERKDGGE